MAHDVFISYSSHDKATADAVCAVMEHRGIRCWMAPRDVQPGQDWATSIIQAINGAKVFLLIFSGFANESGQVKREVERAANRNLPIIPFRIADIAPNETLEFFISSPHWLDAFTPPLHNHAERLAETVERLIGPPKSWPDPERGAQPAPPPEAALESKPPQESRPSSKPQPAAAALAAPATGFSAAIQRNGPFYLLAATVVGASLFSASQILPKASPWFYTPIFAVPVCIALWGWRRIGLIQAALWIAVMSGAHFLAIQTTSTLYTKISHTQLVDAMASFGLGGLIGGSLSLGALVLLGRRLLHQAHLLTAVVGTLVMGAMGSLCGIAFVHWGPNFQLTVFVPWQLIFGVVILAVVQGRFSPSKTQDPFLPPDTIRGGVMAGVAASVALLAYTIAKPDLFKKPDDTPTPPPAADAGATPPAPATTPSESVTPAVAPAPVLAPAPRPAAVPAPKPASSSSSDDPIGEGGFITPPSTPSTGGESFTPAGR
jgi:hypothetical protein